MSHFYCWVSAFLLKEAGKMASSLLLAGTVDLVSQLISICFWE